MEVLIGLLLLAGAALGLTVGIVVTIWRYDRIRAQQHADEEKQAMVQELYSAWAALRAGPPGGRRSSY